MNSEPVAVTIATATPANAQPSRPSRLASTPPISVTAATAANSREATPVATWPGLR